MNWKYTIVHTSSTFRIYTGNMDTPAAATVIILDNDSEVTSSVGRVLT